MIFTCCLFFCVLLHEYGHALTARRFGINTLDIILSPIGGIARLRKMPENPTHEILVAFAGPAVNVLISAALGILIWVIGWDFSPILDELSFKSIEIFVVMTFWLNIMLVVFNLIPAFPMDGGRVLRAILSYKWNRFTATKIAAYIGQFMALCLILLGFWYDQFVLIFIGIFVIITARSELRAVKHRYYIKQTTANELMDINFLVIYPDTTIEESYERLKSSPYDVAIILDYEGRVYGSITQEDMRETMLSGNSTVFPVSSVLENSYEPIYAHQSVKEIIAAFNSYNNDTIPVLSGDIAVGTLNRNQVQNWLTEL